MSDFKDSLNLPETKFPMRGNLPQREPEFLKFWQEQDIYGQQRRASAGKKTFVLHDGPPYANGLIHVGHALNKILKDIIVKSHQLLGYDSAYIPGWDCHGLPIEQKVEQKLGKPGAKVSANEFRRACRDFARSQVELQKADFQRLGVLGDWANPYLTMNYDIEAAIVRSLRKIVANGHVVQGFKPVNWCLDCASTLAEAEVEYEDKVSESIYVRFAVKDLAELARRFGLASVPATDVVIWTTTPWTLPANLAVSLNPDFDYGLFKVGDRHLIVAREMREALQKEWGDEADWQELASVKGQELERLELQHPFLDKTSLLILGDHVTLEAGTGCVHTAPAHGVDDFNVCQRYGIEPYNPVLGNGCFAPDTPIFAGQNVFKANPEVVKLLEERGRLVKASKIKHSYPHCWRHHSPTIFRTTTQWFISMDKAGLRQEALKALDGVEFIPAWGRPRLTNMIAERPDWAITRQRYWGVPLCFVVHKDSGELHPQILDIMEQAAAAIEKNGIEAWFELPLEQLIPDAADYRKLDDVLDVWFDSGTTHETVLARRQRKPADLYLEGSDQHRGWFHSSLLTGCAMDGAAPYRALLTHGFVVDAQGEKMSKSKGNVVEPQKVINSLGADILRLWVASVDYGGEVRLSDDILKQRAEGYRRIRNTCRFLLANLHDFDPRQHLLAGDRLLALDRYVINHTAALQRRLLAHYEQYEFHLVYQELTNFCSIFLGSFYLDVIKDRQYTVAKESPVRRSAQTALFHILEALVRWIAPILSFTAEEIWGHMPARPVPSVFLSEFYSLPPVSEQFSESFWPELLQLRTKVNEALETQRAAGLIGSSLEAALRIVSPRAPDWAVLGDELRFLLLTSAVELVEGPELQISVSKAPGAKCERCWHYHGHLNDDKLCPRCLENMAGGEQRSFI